MRRTLMDIRNGKKKLKLFAFIFSAVLMESCFSIALNESLEESGECIVAEGIVTYYMAGRRINDEVYHSGYILQNPDWIIQPEELPPIERKIFLERDTTIQELSGKHVHVEGKFVSIPGRNAYHESKLGVISHPTYGFMHPYMAILIDTIYAADESD